VRREDGQEVEVNLQEVRQLGETDASFRRSIVTSEETLNTIVDASIRQMQQLRKEADNNRLKIIASALNFEHCRQIVEAYRARGQRADFVHSREEAVSNQRVMQRLENHELDVIVQVRKLGEGFDHPYLAVAAVFSIFSNLSPFVQFVGRIMRVIEQNAPGHPLNQGVVIYHAGANVASRWEDFQEFSQADQEYFDQLLPVEDLDFDSSDELEVVPRQHDADDETTLDVRGQNGIELEVIPLISNYPDSLAALQTLKERGFTLADLCATFEELDPVPVTKVRERQAKRASLDTRVQNTVGRILAERNINPNGKDMHSRHKRTNFVVVKSAIDRNVNTAVGRASGERHEFSRVELDLIEGDFESIVEKAMKEVFDG